MQTQTDLQQIGIEPEKVLKAQEFWRQNPEICSRTFFGSRLWDKQIEVMHSVRDNKKTVVKSGNTVGKSHIAAEIAIDYLLSYYPSKVITTAPTWNQVENILWKEIASLFHKSQVPIGGQLNQTELKFNDEWFAMGA